MLGKELQKQRAVQIVLAPPPHPHPSLPLEDLAACDQTSPMEKMLGQEVGRPARGDRQEGVKGGAGRWPAGITGPVTLPPAPRLPGEQQGPRE